MASRTHFGVDCCWFVSCFWLASVLLTRLIYTPDADAFIRASDVLARYIIGIPERYWQLRQLCWSK